MFYGRRDMCLTCRLALESGEVQIVRMDDDEDGDAPAVVRAEDVMHRAGVAAAAGPEPEQEGGEPEVPQAERAAESTPAPAAELALSPWPPPREELERVAADRTIPEIAELYGVSITKVRNVVYNHRIPYRRLRKRRRNVEAVPTHPAASAPATTIANPSDREAEAAAAMDSESATRANIPAADVQTSDDDGARFAAAMQRLIDLAGEVRRLGRKHHDRFQLEIIVRL